MRILAIDTTGLAASVAVVGEDITIGEFTISLNKTHSQTIMPMVDGLLNMMGLSVADMDYIACGSGPGSFTGLRIGAATAKGLSFGLNKEIVPVPTLDALAYNILNAEGIVVPIMDARRGQVYAAAYAYEKGGLVRLTDYLADDIGVVLKLVKDMGRTAVFTGDGVFVHYDSIIKNEGFLIAPPHLNRQRAAAVGSLAVLFAKRGETVAADKFSPFYLRKPQAEREFKE